MATRPCLQPIAGPSRIGYTKRTFASLPRLFPQPVLDPRRRKASTSSSNTDWLSWLKKSSALRVGNGSDVGSGGKALLFAGLGSYPHTPYSPTPSSLNVWEQASEALLTEDPGLGYETRGMEEFVGHFVEDRGIRAWMRGWVEGRSLDELMARADVTAAFILSSSIAILASEQEKSGSSTLLPEGTTHLVGHGFIGTLTALVASGQLDLATGVRLARIYASLSPVPFNEAPSPPTSRQYKSTVLSARQFHSLASPSLSAPFNDPFSGCEEDADQADCNRKRAMQLILDEFHGLQQEWKAQKSREWAEPAIINSSKVLVATGTHGAVSQVIELLQQLNLANPVLDVHMPCPFNTTLMEHAKPDLNRFLERLTFKPSQAGVTTLDPITTHPLENLPSSLLPHLTCQLRWHKTLSRLIRPPVPEVSHFLTVGKGAKGLGVMLRGELKKRPEGSGEVKVSEFGVKDADPGMTPTRRRTRSRAHV